MTTGHRITITPRALHVEVAIDGHTVAASDCPVVLEETGLPTRYYLPRGDLKADLRPSAKHTACPFKGSASYWSVEVDGTWHEDVAWSYETPIPEAEGIAGLVCFYNERVELSTG